MTRNSRGHLGIALRKFREGRAMSGKELSSAAGMSPGHLSELEQGRRNMTSALAARLAAVFDQTAADFIDNLTTIAESIQDEEPVNVLRETLSPYNVKPPVSADTIQLDRFRELAESIVKTMSPNDAWDLVRKYTNAAQAGDHQAAVCAQAMIEILSPPPNTP